VRKVNHEGLRRLLSLLREVTDTAEYFGMVRLGEEHSWSDDFKLLVNEIVVAFFGGSYDIYWSSEGFVLPVLYRGELALIAFDMDENGAWGWHLLDDLNRTRRLLTQMVNADVDMQPRFEYV